MRVRFAGLATLCFAVLLGLVPVVVAQGNQQKAAPQQSNIQGVVQMINTNTSTITVRIGTTPRQVVYSKDTKFLYGHSDNNKPGALAQVKQSNYISCVGTFDAKNALVAKECVYREER